ncbi:MAG: DivIVA domain-containing protein [Desulfovibrionaceae bacterium]|nr:DivIVA domain-containing protein [Desulfovibrionaceae bacterium]
MSVTRIDVLNKTFSRSFRGYDRAEVDVFMQEAADALGALAEENKAVKMRLAELEAALGEHRGREKTLRDTLLTTQKMTEEMKATAQKEAQLIIDAAHAKSEHMVNQGHMRLAQIHEDIQSMKKLRAQFDMQLRGIIDTYLKLLDMNQKEEEELDAVESKITFIRKAEGI